MAMAEAVTEVQARVALDVDACIECRTCAAACLYGHGDMPVVYFARVGAAMLPALCRQCQDAPCVAACPAEAMLRDPSGAVYRAMFRCRGCECCVRACPFGVLVSATFAGAIAKCDLCVDRTAAGLQPRCVASCPAGALHFLREQDADQHHLVVLGSRTLGQHPIRRR